MLVASGTVMAVGGAVVAVGGAAVMLFQCRHSGQRGQCAAC